MKNKIKYKRVLIKISGGALSSKKEGILDIDKIKHIIDEVVEIQKLGIEVAIVIGGGNILRGSISNKWGIERVEADLIGMMGTIVNALMLRAYLKANHKFEVRVMSAVNINEAAEPYIRLRAIKHLSKGFIVIFAGGIGQPYLTTDYPSVQRAIEINSEVVLVAKSGVNGIYSKDPNIFPEAKRYKTLDYNEYISKRLKVMDQSSIVLASEHSLPLYVFDFEKKGTMKEICMGGNVGTLLSNEFKTTFY